MIPLLQDDEEQEMEAMKTQFKALHKRQLNRQSSNQFILRTPTQQTDDNDQKYNYDNVAIDNDKKHFPDYADANTKVDEEDVAAMKDAFDKQKKLLLKTQIEKSFRLSIPGDTENTDDNNNDNENENEIETHNDNTDLDRLPRIAEESDGKDDNKDDDDSIDLSSSDIDQETEEKLVEDSEEMKMQFQELNKMMIRYRSTKTIEMGMSTPQIKPQHKEQFNMLMNDIGIVNQTIMRQLWTNIEKTVNDDNEEEDDDEGDDTNTLIQKLQEDNEALRKQIKKEEDITHISDNVIHHEDEKPGFGLFFKLKLTGCCGT